MKATTAGPYMQMAICSMVAGPRPAEEENAERTSAPEVFNLYSDCEDDAEEEEDPPPLPDQRPDEDALRALLLGASRGATVRRRRRSLAWVRWGLQTQRLRNALANVASAQLSEE